MQKKNRKEHAERLRACLSQLRAAALKESFILFLIFLFVCILDTFCGVVNLKINDKIGAGITLFGAGASFIIMIIHASRLLG